MTKQLKNDKMKKSKITIVLFFFITLSVYTFGQTKTNFYQVIKVEKAINQVFFFAAFASSNEVWEETKTIFKEDHTCYVLTMVGFAEVASHLNSFKKIWKPELPKDI